MDTVAAEAARSGALGVSVIICTNRKDGILSAVGSVATNDYEKLELVIVIQGWQARELEDELKAAFPGRSLKLVEDSGRGLSRARNLGIRAATGDVLLFTDDDCLVVPDWVAKHVAIYEENRKTALVFGAVRGPSEWTASDGEVPTFDPDSTRGSSRNQGRYALGMGANMSVRASALATIGLFDEQIGAGAPLASGEDIDFALRAIARNLLVVADARPVVLHHGGVRPRGTESRKLWRRDGIGLGAVVAKRVRVRDWGGAGILARRVGDLNLNAVRALLEWRRPFGARLAAEFTLGVVVGLTRGAVQPLERALSGERFSD